jgi:energy-converting hydrogenase Eha subunit A
MMLDATLVQTRIVEGVWEGVLTGVSDPHLVAEHLGTALPVGVTPLPDQAGAYQVRIPIPPHVLAEGVQTVLIRLDGQTERLASFTIIAGLAVDADLRAEIDLLRAELDMLKRAFRRHCLETAG